MSKSQSQTQKSEMELKKDELDHMNRIINQSCVCYVLSLQRCAAGAEAGPGEAPTAAEGPASLQRGAEERADGGPSLVEEGLPTQGHRHQGRPLFSASHSYSPSFSYSFSNTLLSLFYHSSFFSFPLFCRYFFGCMYQWFPICGSGTCSGTTRYALRATR